MINYDEINREFICARNVKSMSVFNEIKTKYLRKK